MAGIATQQKTFRLDNWNNLTGLEFQAAVYGFLTLPTEEYLKLDMQSSIEPSTASGNDLLQA